MKLIEHLKAIVKMSPLMSSYYRRRRDFASLNRVVSYRENLGFYFNGPVEMENGVFEPRETMIFEKLINKFEVFINIGANTGYYACKALARGVDTIAFEPNNLNTNILLRNIEANRFPGEFQLFPIALSNKIGIMPMFGDSTGASLIQGWAGQYNKTLVPVSTFDRIAGQFVRDKKSFILIDIEGAELNCLKGCETLLSSENDNVFLIEITVGEHQPSGVDINPGFLETFEFMYSHRYTAYTVNDQFRTINLSEIRNIASTGVDTLGTHNFLFVRDSIGLSDLGLQGMPA